MSSKKKIKIEELIAAYAGGYFPMAHPESNNAIYWHQPEMRGIIPLDKYHIPGNLRREYVRYPYLLTINRDFEGVIKGCAERESTWISKEIISAYTQLHELGMAVSFEAWKHGELVGGLYGVVLGKAYFGESMFHRATNASKHCLVFLIQTLVEREFKLLDTQYLNPHLEQFGAIEVPHSQYMALLEEALLHSNISYS